MRLDESVQRILKQKDTAVELFYQRFLDRYPQVSEFFVGVDLRQQAVMLTMALVLVENHYTHSFPATEHYLRVLGHRHSLWKIPPEFYPLFRKCLLETLAEILSDDWNESLEHHWAAALDKATATMLEGYERPYIY